MNVESEQDSSVKCNETRERCTEQTRVSNLHKDIRSLPEEVVEKIKVRSMVYIV